MEIVKKHSYIALAYFFLIVLLGLVMRLFPITPIAANYKFLVHAHSHVALLGWVYTALTTILYFLYLHEQKKIKQKYKSIFIVTQITIIGMLLTFPFTGYAIISIVFSTSFLLASYYFTWLFLKFTPEHYKHLNSYKLIRVSLWFMILSSLGPWTLGIIMNTLGQASNLYKNAIYFYLHFQYNGWFLVAILGIFTRLLELQHTYFTKKAFTLLFWCFNIGVLATYLISVLWTTPKLYIYSIAIIGSTLQLIAFVIFTCKLRKIQCHTSKFLIEVFLLFFAIKLLMQLLGSFPFIANNISYNVDLVIGYIHWIFIGVVSLALLILMKQLKLIVLSKFSINLYLTCFLITELLLFYKGAVIWFKLKLTPYYYIILAIASAVLFVAVFSILLSQAKKITLGKTKKELKN